MEKSLKEAHDQLEHLSEKFEKQEKALNDALRTRPEDKETLGDKVERMEKSLKEDHDQLKHDLSEKSEKQEKALNDVLQARPEEDKKKETPAGDRLDTKSILKKAIADLVTSNEVSKSSSDYILLNLLKDHNPPEVYGETITNEQEEHDRCERYGLKYNTTLRNTRRRIFFGSLIANDAIQILAAHAAEAHGLYHTVALVKSNTTFMGTPRETLYSQQDSTRLRLLQSMFGPKTNVTVEQFVNPPSQDSSWIRE